MLPMGLTWVNVEVHGIGPTCGTTEWPGWSVVQSRLPFPLKELLEKLEWMFTEGAVGSQ